MNKLAQNIITMHGEKGKAWLSSLPSTIKMLADHWKLKNLVPVDNMTFNYVAKALDDTNQPVILKISYDEKSIADEVLALKYFNARGSIKLIDHNEHYHALLLQQATPGEALTQYAKQTEYVMDCILMAAWQIEDNSDPRCAITLAEKLM